MQQVLERKMETERGVKKNMGKMEETKQILTDHVNQYPNLRPEDIFKFLYQSCFGCEHLLFDSFFAFSYLEEEVKKCGQDASSEIENLDGDYCRVPLGVIRNGLSVETLAKLFVLSAKGEKKSQEELQEKLTVADKLAKERKFPFSEEEFKEALSKWEKAGCPACHHSAQFRENYQPAYRVIKKEYVRFLPLFTEIDKEMEKGDFTLAIEGGSASGKSTLGALLEQVYDCNLFHMDDFFLQSHQRTKERLTEPGGNVDRERFLEEVLQPLSKKEMVSYRRFHCGKLTMEPACDIPYKKLNIVEGAYCMHPELEGYYDFSIFLDVEEEIQRARILKRNLGEFAKRFFEEWIPMERNYFEKMQVKDRCQMVFEIR